MSEMFKLNVGDLSKGLVTAVFAGVIVALAGAVQAPGFDLFSADWASIGKVAFNAGFVTLVAYLGKNFLSTADGKVLGRIG